MVSEFGEPSSDTDSPGASALVRPVQEETFRHISPAPVRRRPHGVSGPGRNRWAGWRGGHVYTIQRLRAPEMDARAEPGETSAIGER